MPHSARSLPLSRRRLLVGAATTALLAACGESDASTVTPAAPAAPSTAVLVVSPAPLAPSAAGIAVSSPVAATTMSVPIATMPSAMAAPALSPAPASVAPTLAQRLGETAGKGSEIDTLDLAGKTVQIEFWHTQTKANADVLNRLCTDFTAANPGITVSLQYLGNTNTLAKKLLVAISAGQAPTVAAAIEANAAAFQQTNALTDLTPYINSKRYGWSSEDLNDIYPAFLERGVFPQFGDQMLSVPFTPAVLMMWYNLDFLKRLGFSGPAKTWTEFQTQAMAAVKAGKRGWPVSVEASQVEALVYTHAGEVISADETRALFDSPQALAGLSVLEAMGKAGTARQVEANTNSSDDLAQFVGGDAPFIFDSSAGRSTIAAALANDPKDLSKGFKFNWNGAIIPQGSESARPVTVLNGANTVLFRGTPEKQLAGWLLMKYLNTREATVTWSTNTGYLPIRQSAITADAMVRFFAQAPQNRAPFDLAPFGRGEPKAAGWTTARDDIAEIEVQLMNGTLNARDAAQRLQQKVSADLKPGT